MKVLILTPYPPDTAPNQRFRFEQYLDYLSEQNIEVDYRPFIDWQTWNTLYQPGKFIKKAWGILKAFTRRFRLMTQLTPYDYVFVCREASHIGPPIFEWLIAKVFQKKIIYDFDDAIWLPNYSYHNRHFHRLKFYGKVRSNIKWSYKISAGNDYLADFARQYNSNVIVNPTTIDTENYHFKVKNQQTDKLIIGWTGTLTTAKYLKPLASILDKLSEEFEFEFQMISNEVPYDFAPKSLRFVPWKKESEIDDLLAFNIGIMPLTEDKWAKGKCGFKALQYMALGIPALVSPVGVNTNIVDHEINGFLCQTPEQWYNALKQLLSDAELRIKMGKAARQKIISHYSVLSNRQNFLSLFS